MTATLSDNRDAVRRWLPLIVGLAVGLRVGLALFHPIESATFGDARDYDDLARAIVGHMPYEVRGLVASRMPGYPVFVAMVYAVAGYSLKAVLVVQGLLGGVAVVLTYLIARRCGATPRGGMLAAALAAVDPLSVGFSATLLSEAAFTPLLLAAVWLGLRITHEHRMKDWIALGIIWGAAVYMRASALWCFAPLAAWICWMIWRREGCRSVGVSGYRSVGVAAMGALVAVGVVFLALSPWLVRNYRIFGSGPLRLTTLEGISLYEAVYPQADGGPRQDKITVPPDMAGLNEAQRNDEWMRRGWGYVGSEPGRIMRLALVKAGRTWSPTFSAAEFQKPALQAVMLLWHVPLFILGLVGVGRRFCGKGVLLVPLAYFTLVHALFIGSVRYRVPLMPLVCIFAALGVAAIVARWKRGQR